MIDLKKKKKKGRKKKPVVGCRSPPAWRRPSCNVQTRWIIPSLALSGQPPQSINRTRVRRESWGFSAAKAAPFRTYESSQMSNPPPPSFSSSSSPSLHLQSHSFHSRVAGEEGGAPSALSDESDNRQRCFGSGDTALAKHFVCACVGVRVCVEENEALRRAMKD